MVNQGEITSAFDTLWRKSSERNWEYGRLGIANGAGYTIDVPDRPGYKYVSKGVNGDLGSTTALDRVGVAAVGNQPLRMRWEQNRLVIREAGELAAGGGSGGATTLDALTDVTLTAPANGNTLQYNSTTSQWINVVPAGGSGGAPSPHDLSSSHHSGLLSWSLLNKAGSSLTDIASRPHSALTGITPDQHHNQVHPIVGSDHTATGLTTGHVIRASGATTFAWAQLQHTDLGNILPNQHHNQVHSIIGSDHTIVGNALDLVGATAANTLGLVIPSSNPGATGAVLRSSSNGSLNLDGTLFAVNAATDQVTIDSPLFIANAGSDVITMGSAFVTADALNHLFSIDSPLFVVDGSANTVKVQTTLFVASAAANSVTMDGTLFSVNASSDIVSMDSTLLVVNAASNLVTMDTNVFYLDAPNNRIGINQTPGNAALDIISSANADHTQRIRQKTGQTGRLWRIENTTGQELIVLDSQGNLQSGLPGFVSGLTGWQITPTGTAEFNNVWVRGELHASVFVKDEVHISGGTLLIATGAKLYSDAIINSTAMDTEPFMVETSAGTSQLVYETSAGNLPVDLQGIYNFIEIEDSPTGPGTYFDEGEVIRCKTEVPTGITDLWFTIISASQLTGYQRYSVIKRSGTDATLPAGSGVASYGFPGDGRILLTSDLNYAPYMDVFTIGPNVWTGAAGAQVPHVRVGRLDGVGVTGTSGIKQFGIIAGTDLSDANSPYIIASNLQLRLHKVNLTLNDGSNDTGSLSASGNLTLGSNISVDAGKSLQVINGTTDGTAGDIIIGQLAGNYLQWDQSAALLTIKGSLQVAGVDVKSYIDSQDASVTSTAATDATSKSNAAQTNAQTYGELYGNARRVVQVSGDWKTGTTANVVTWTSVSLRMANGITKSVVNGNSGAMSIGVRVYLYVDVTSVAANWTLLATTNFTTLGANHALIAVCDAGLDKASVAIVAGSTYIAGDNIMTGSIVAGNIKAGSITATEISSVTMANINSYADGAASSAAGTAQTTAQTYSDARRIVRATGIWSSSGTQTITWTSVILFFANGQSRTVADGSRVMTVTANHFWYVADATAAQPLTFEFVTGTTGAIPAGATLVAIGTPSTATGTTAAVRIVGGATWIGGDQIATGSIVTGHITAGAVHANQVTVDSTIAIASGGSISGGGRTFAAGTGFFLGHDAGAPAGYKFVVGSASQYLSWNGSTLTIVGNLTIAGSASPIATESYATSAAGTAQTNAAIDATTKANQAETNATTYAANYNNDRRVMRVIGNWSAVDADTISWGSPSALQVTFANGTTKTITASNTGNMTTAPSGPRYLHVNPTAVSPLTMGVATSADAIPVGNTLIAVATPGNILASVTIVGGGTYISGDQIITGTIVATNLQAFTITANELAANSVTTAKILAGNVTADKMTIASVLQIQSGGFIYANTKSTYANGAGFYLGYSASAPAGYKFDIGDNNGYLRWDGANLLLKTASPPSFGTSSASAYAFSMGGPSNSAKVWMNSSNQLYIEGVTPTSVELNIDGRCYATEFKMSGNTFQIAAQRTGLTPTATGLVGEIAWEHIGGATPVTWLYLCFAANQWKRIQIPNTPW